MSMLDDVLSEAGRQIGAYAVHTAPGPGEREVIALSTMELWTILNNIATGLKDGTLKIGAARRDERHVDPSDA